MAPSSSSPSFSFSRLLKNYSESKMIHEEFESEGGRKRKRARKNKSDVNDEKKLKAENDFDRHLSQILQMTEFEVSSLQEMRILVGIKYDYNWNVIVRIGTRTEKTEVTDIKLAASDAKIRICKDA